MSIRLIIRSIVIAVCLSMTVKAYGGNGPDAVRAGLFVKYAAQAKKALRSQDVLLGTNLTEHIYHKQQVDKIAEYHKELNRYLESFGDILSIAAEIYGIYYEVDQAIRNVNELKKVVSSSPANIVAVALSERKNNVYQDVISDGVQFASDVAMMLPIRANKNSKMTEAERFSIIKRIRKNLRNMNVKIRAMNRLVYSTTLMDSWYELTGQTPNTRTMKEIVTDSQKRWVTKLHKVKY